MKTKYEKPLFIVENYTFSDSIAKCDIDIDTTEPLKIYRKIGDEGTNTKLCGVMDEGHVWGGQNGKKGSIIDRLKETRNQITLFNDGDSLGCQYDWDGRNNVVAQTGDSFAESFFGNDANPDNHAPAYNGQVFMS